MKINPIIFAVLLIASQQALAQMPDGTTLAIEKLALNTSFGAAEVSTNEPIRGHNQRIPETGTHLTSPQAPLSATIEKVAQGLESKLDQRMKMDFELGDTAHPRFAFAY
mgnify:CR=1 FL=1|jgi:hypothetical protein